MRLQGIDLSNVDHALVADIQHNPEWIGRAARRYMPALMRQSRPWNLQRKRPMIPLEHLLVNAFPVWAPVPPVPLEYLESLPSLVVRHVIWVPSEALSASLSSTPLRGVTIWVTAVCKDHSWSSTRVTAVLQKARYET